MKIIEIDGGDGGYDYGVTAFEDTGMSREEAYNKAVSSGGSFQHVSDDGCQGFEVRVHEFGEVDPCFVDFIKDIEDYDRSKHHSFFVV